MIPGCSPCGLAVEWVRSCYESEWRLFAGSDVVTRGRYYFAADDTPFVAGYHNFGSKDWLDNNNGLENPKGELLKPNRSWDPGSPPAVLPNAIQLGDPGCMTAGENIADGLDYDDTIDGIPPQCFLPDPPDPWPDVATFRHCAVQRFYARIIDWLYEDQAARITEAFELLMGPSVVVKVRPQASDFPAMVTVKLGSIFICVLDGTRNFQQLALQGLYSLTTPQDFGILDTNPFWYQASAYVIGKMVEDGLAPDMRVMLAGHSYGAAVTCLVAARLHAAVSMRAIRFLTYGCPKPGGEKLETALTPVEGLNLANVNDIVTILPPDEITLAPVQAALGLPLLSVWTKWLRPLNQLGINADGTVDPNAFPWLDFNTLLAIAQDVLNAVAINPVTGHSIKEYYRRLTLRCPGKEWPIDKPLDDWLTLRPIGLTTLPVSWARVGLRSWNIPSGHLGLTRLHGQFDAVALTSLEPTSGELAFPDDAAEPEGILMEDSGFVLLQDYWITLLE